MGLLPVPLSAGGGPQGPSPGGSLATPLGPPSPIQLSILEECQQVLGAWLPHSGSQQKDCVDTGPGTHLSPGPTSTRTRRAAPDKSKKQEGKQARPACRGVFAPDRLRFTGARGLRHRRRSWGVWLGGGGEEMAHTRSQESLPTALTGPLRAPRGPRPPPPGPYLLRTSLARMGARRLKVDLDEWREQSSQARGLGGRPGPRLLCARNSLACSRSL